MTKLSKKEFLVVHHSATPNNLKTQDIKQMHIAQGWSDIGYHKVIEYDGKVMQGRNEATQGAQAYGLNNKSLGILIIGNFETEEPTQEQITALINTLAILCKRYKLKESAIIGHRDVQEITGIKGTGTLCPGKNLYFKLDDIREKVKKYL